jgi:hypothetical protein
MNCRSFEKDRLDSFKMFNLYFCKNVKDAVFHMLPSRAAPKKTNSQKKSRHCCKREVGRELYSQQVGTSQLVRVIDESGLKAEFDSP